MAVLSSPQRLSVAGNAPLLRLGLLQLLLCLRHFAAVLLVQLCEPLLLYRLQLWVHAAASRETVGRVVTEVKENNRQSNDQSTTIVVPSTSSSVVALCRSVVSSGMLAPCCCWSPP